MFNLLFGKFTGKTIGSSNRAQLTCKDEDVREFVENNAIYYRYEKRGPNSTLRRREGESSRDLQMRRMGYKRVNKDWFASDPEYFAKGTKVYETIKEGLAEGKTTKQIQNKIYGV